MIHVERGPAPPEYISRGSSALRKLTAFFRRAPEERAQERPPIETNTWRLAKELLLERFHGKCAYYESSIVDLIEANLENFRPKSYYWWLTYEWNNLLVACRGCNSAKADRFPLKIDSTRAEQLGEEMSEHPLLLDPCQDWPEEHLAFGDDGDVYSDTERGQATIDTLGLNRLALVKMRRRVAIQVLGLLEVARIGGSSGPLLHLVTDEAPYAGTARQVLRRTLEKLKRQGHLPAKLDRLEEQLLDVARTSEPAPKAVGATKLAYKAHEQAVEAFSLPMADGAPVSERYFAKRRTIERIAIKNFKAIRKLDIDLAVAPEAASSWLMLLGENGTGKSTVLKALALTLMSEKRRKDLHLRPVDVLSHETSEGYVRVWLTGVSKPLELTYRSGDEAFGGEIEEKVLLLGYGSTRLLPRPEMKEESIRGPVQVANLFDPTARLADAEDWLAGLDPKFFGPAVRVLKMLLPLRKEDRLRPEDKPEAGGRRRVFVQMFGHEVPLRDLSDGYQSVLALTADVLSVLIPVWKERVESAEGIVLIDELDAHLHPTWRMRMVHTLRGCFPNVQFITTSHDPLCLKGLRAGEVVVLRRNRRGRVVAVEDLPSPEGMSVDQLLTSEHFGLGSTVDPEVEQIFRENYALLARKERSTAQEKRLGELKTRLALLNHMGRTRREQLMLEVIDAYLAEDIPPGRQAQEERRRHALEQLIAKWTGKGEGGGQV